MTLSALLSRWRAEPTVFENIVEWRTIPARIPQFVAFPPDLHPALITALQFRGLESLYSHQVQAWEHLKKGANVAIVTGTASGKTLAYNIPVLDRLLRQPDTRALYIFPTKALAQDQLSTLRILLQEGIIKDKEDIESNPLIPYPISPSVYDGDTPTQSRPSIRTSARLVITNPDMLHTGILPNHTRWSSFFQHLHYVVIDEMHTYRGVFGSHVANLIRRLVRIASFYGRRPQFILTSATIANPAELAEKLIDSPVVIIDEDGSLRGSKHFLIYNPPVVDRNLGMRRSALVESVRLAEDLLHYNVQTIVFGHSRQTVELILSYLRDKANPLPSTSVHPPVGGKGRGNQLDASSSIRGYRSGYLPRQRREIEFGLRRGDVQLVVATNALELGIDIGGMGAALLVGYPGTIAATWQQSGRAGRGDETSLTLLVASASPLDQFLANHPQYFFERSPEQALINPDNLLILLAHLRCAAYELPFQAKESFGSLPAEQVVEFMEFLIEEGVLHHSGSKYFWMADRYPAEKISLRSASPEHILLQIPQEGNWTTIGEVDIESAAWMVHPNAIYLHEAQTYQVDELDFEHHLAYLHPINVDYYTQPRREITVQLLETLDHEKAAGAMKFHGEILVTTQVTGFRKLKWFTHEQLGMGELSLPPSQLHTTGYWLTLSPENVEQLREQGLWRNDPNRYGPSWDLLREHVRARDDYRCQICGALETGRAHDVHHKVPLRAFTSLEQANQLSNLITLCSSCHRRVEAIVRIRSGLAGLAYVLGNLAPFFLMCDPRDLGVHSDQALSFAESAPGVVLYDMIPAGIGFSQRLFELHDLLIHKAFELVSHCDCSDGCPSCVGPAGENGLGGKQETLAILSALV